jgi:Kef-type K+ transport system membrane component KefB
LKEVLLSFFILFLAAKIAGELFKRLKLPEMIGELLVGIIIGPSALYLVKPSNITEAIATLGVIILLFSVGLETDVSKYKKVGFQAFLTAVLGIILPFIFIIALTHYLGEPAKNGLFLATATVATSVGITARVLTELKVLQRKESYIILAAAVIDDILGLFILSIIVAINKTHSFSFLDFSIVLIEVIAFILFATILAPKLIRRHASLINKLHISSPALNVSLIFLLGLSALANYIGLAAIVGAFFAGIIFAETDDREELQKQVNPIYHFLVPFFFVVTGTQVQLKIFTNPAILGIGLVITFLAIFGKVLAGLLANFKIGIKRSLIVGVGMIPRGEVGLIVASIGLSLNAIGQRELSQIIFMSVATTLIVPPILPLVFKFAEKPIKKFNTR